MIYPINVSLGILKQILKIGRMINLIRNCKLQKAQLGVFDFQYQLNTHFFRK